LIFNLFSSVAKSLTVSAVGIPISSFHSEIILVTVPAPSYISLAILSLCSPLNHFLMTSCFM
jgi:hypothetical protein